MVMIGVVVFFLVVMGMLMAVVVDGFLFLPAVHRHRHVGSGNAAGLCRGGADRHPRQAQRVHLVHKGLLVLEKIIQCRHQHIAGGAHAAFQVQGFHSSFSPSI